MKRIVAIATPIICTCIAFLIVLTAVIIPNHKYSMAIDLFNNGKYDEAILAFELLNGYKDSEQLICECQKSITYSNAVTAIENKEYIQAIELLESINDFKDSTILINTYRDKIYDNAINLYNEGEFQEAYDLFVSLNSYQDSFQMITKCTEKNWKQMLSCVWAVSENPYYEITFNFDKKTANMEFHSGVLDESYSGTFEIVDFDTILISEGLINTSKGNKLITLKRWNNKCLTSDNSQKYDPVLIIKN